MCMVGDGDAKFKNVKCSINLSTGHSIIHEFIYEWVAMCMHLGISCDGRQKNMVVRLKGSRVIARGFDRLGQLWP